MTTLIVDAGALYAQADADEPQHAAIAAVLQAERDHARHLTGGRS